MAQIEALRRQRLTEPQIARRLGMARSTVGLILRRLGLGRLALLEPKPPIIRYERSRPGEMIHLDIKKLGRFDRAGDRVTGDRQAGRSRKAGWDFLHVCVDDASRLAYTEILPFEGQRDTTAFLRRALDWLAMHGVAVERVMTDNGSAYRSRQFAVALQQAGARHVRTRPYTPRTNGKAERSSRPLCVNGPTLGPTPLRTSAPPPSSPGPTSTTSTGLTPASKASPHGQG